MRTTKSNPSGPAARSVRPPDRGVGRSTSEVAEQVSDDLRRGAGQHLTGRRRVAGLALASIVSFAAVAAYQMGILRHLPDPPLPGFDSDRVDASGEAYAFGRTPDSGLAIASYAVTLALAGMGRADRAHRHPLIPLALAAKVVIDVGGAAYLTAEQVTKHRKVCTYCTAASLLTFAMVPAVLPEARSAWRALRGRNR